MEKGGKGLDDNDDDDGDELFLWQWMTQERCISNQTIVRDTHHSNLQYAASRTWTYTETEFKLISIKWCSRDKFETFVLQEKKTMYTKY